MIPGFASVDYLPCPARSAADLSAANTFPKLTRGPGASGSHRRLSGPAPTGVAPARDATGPSIAGSLPARLQDGVSISVEPAQLSTDEIRKLQRLGLGDREDTSRPVLHPDAEANVVPGDRHGSLRAFEPLVLQIAGDAQECTLGILLPHLHPGKKSDALRRRRVQQLDWELLSAANAVGVRGRLLQAAAGTEDLVHVIPPCLPPASARARGEPIRGHRIAASPLLSAANHLERGSSRSVLRAGLTAPVPP